MATDPFSTGSAINPDLVRLVDATRAGNAAALASALIVASGRPHSMAEAIELMRDIQYSMHPVTGMGHYEKWKKTFDPKKVHA